MRNESNVTGARQGAKQSPSAPPAAVPGLLGAALPPTLERRLLRLLRETHSTYWLLEQFAPAWDTEIRATVAALYASGRLVLLNSEPPTSMNAAWALRAS